MSGVNKVILIGRTGKEVDLKTLPNGSMVASFSLATSEKYKDKSTGETKEITDWHNIILWRGLAEIASKYVHKGDMIYIEGKIRTRSWEQNGEKKYITEIIADTLQMLSGKGQKPQSENEETRDFTPADFAGQKTDDLPF